MPNRNSNYLEIDETKEKLVEDGWLIVPFNKVNDETTYIFNLHKLFPEQYPEPYKEIIKSHNDDGVFLENKFGVATPIYTDSFNEAWNYSWCVNNIGTKWTFDMVAQDTAKFESGFETARSPPIGLLEKFHELSGINLTCEYEEPGMCFEGKLNCEGGDCIDDQQEYRPYCEGCDRKVDAEEMHWIEEEGIDMCDKCIKDHGSTCCGATIRNGLCSDCKEHNEGLTYEE